MSPSDRLGHNPADSLPSDSMPDYFSRETFTDCTGKRRQFDLEVRARPGHGCSGSAREVTNRADGGYVFRTFTDDSVTLALGRLRNRVRAGIALRYLIPGETGTPDLPFERMRGHIEAGGVVVDGKLMGWEAMRRLMETYEGFEFDLRITDEPDW